MVKLYESGKSQNALATKYGIAVSSIARWVKRYSEVKIDDGTILTARQIQRMLSRDYGLHISIGRVYRLMKTMNLPKMSTSKPVFKRSKSLVSLERPNHLNKRSIRQHLIKFGQVTFPIFP
ncbi:helix-turn-helix domain-containing protein [Enterococcus faecalis]|uniref:helix-turn-helix domain-containing protein n=1 Tax=Enterococcus faecalis TaxID=1351 RepID=UPI003D0989C5